MEKPQVSIFWHRRDLRIEDNAGLFHALSDENEVLPIFIFDKSILEKLEDKNDRRVHFIHTYLKKLNSELEQLGSSIQVFKDYPLQVFQKLTELYHVKKVFTNNDYEPYAVARDNEVSEFLATKGISFESYKDHVIFEKNEVLKDDGKPYTVYTPFSKKWLSNLQENDLKPFQNKALFHRFFKTKAFKFPSLQEIGFEASDGNFPDANVSVELLKNYAENRDIPGIRGTSRLSVHLRFGTVSIRQFTALAQKHSKSWLNELIWRNFYMFIIWHFPHAVNNSFKKPYDNINWRNNEQEFESWCKGETGYPIVDAGMRELNSTGFMHNRVRMITASFLVKHLLIDWRWGEAYFARKLIDFELASNNGGWQWAASSGCDSAPYFRVFNPELQTKKFDPNLSYIKKYVPEFQELTYPKPIVDHKMARERVLNVYKQALNS